MKRRRSAVAICMDCEKSFESQESSARHFNSRNHIQRLLAIKNAPMMSGREVTEQVEQDSEIMTEDENDEQWFFDYEFIRWREFNKAITRETYFSMPSKSNFLPWMKMLMGLSFSKREVLFAVLLRAQCYEAKGKNSMITWITKCISLYITANIIASGQFWILREVSIAWKASLICNFRFTTFKFCRIFKKFYFESWLFMIYHK